MIPVDLRTSGLIEPLGLDRTPVFSWKLRSDRRDIVFEGAEVRVADANGEAVWESGWVDVPGAPSIRYAGPDLAARADHTWSVRVRTRAGETTRWSDSASFETGVLGGGFGEASWIRLDEQPEPGERGPVQYLRREFSLASPVVRARTYSTALGWYRLHVNGVDVTGPGFYPGFTAFDSRVEYQVRDVAEHLKEGANAIGMILSDGRFRGRIGALGTPAMYGERTAAIAFLEIEHADGTRTTIGSDGSWTGGHGDIVVSDPRSGETIDARRRSAWSEVGGSLAGDVAVIEVDEDRTLVGESAEPMVHAPELQPVETHRAPSGKLIVDFGQNLHGVARIVAQGPEGAELVVTHSEVLGKDGEVGTAYLFGGMPVDGHIGPDRLILSGRRDDFVPTFCTQGFRYIAVEAPDDVEFVEFASIPVHAGFAYAGTFRTSNELVNRFHDNVVWSMRGNFLDVPTDCPTRERSGWTGDAQVFTPAALLLAQAGPFFANWLTDMRAQQHADGTIPDVVPFDSPNWREGAAPLEIMPGVTMPPSGSAGWGDAIVLIPWEVYRSTGSLEVLSENYDAMAEWIERYARMAASTADPDSPNSRYLVDSGYHWGEWLEPEGEGDGQWSVPDIMVELATNPRSWVATAYFEHSSRLMAEIATILGRGEDAVHFAEYADGALAAWRESFATDPVLLEPDAQSSYVRALEFDLVPDDRRAATVAQLVARIRARDTHLGTGFLSTGFLMRQLSRNGEQELALDLLLQESAPSWLGQVVRGATTVWETWTGHDAEGNPAMSHNHYSLGGSVRWLYEDLAGIRAITPAWRHILVDPVITDRIPSVAASTATPFGVVAVDWSLADDRVTLTVDVPAGAEATVVLTGADVDQATRDGHALPPLAAGADERGPRVVVGSGRSVFEWAR